MQQADEPACIADRLFEPGDGLGRAGAGVFGEEGVFLHARGFVGAGNGENEEEGVGGPRDEG